MRALSTKIEVHRGTLQRTRADIEEVNTLLAAKQGEVTLQDLIENEGKRNVRSRLGKKLDDLGVIIGRIETGLRDIDEKINFYTDQGRARTIVDAYLTYMRRFLHLLNVTEWKEADYRLIETAIKETGSDQPRAVLAYFFSILHTIKRFGSSTFCPIVIDAPNQQEQDIPNFRAMLNFIKDHGPDSSQLILALVDDCDVDFGGTTIDLKEKNFALTDKDYKTVADELRPYAKASLGLEPLPLFPQS